MWTLILFWVNVFKRCIMLTFFLLRISFESIISRSARERYAKDFVHYFNEKRRKFRLKFVYGILPAFVFYTDKYVPRNVAGVAYENLVFIRPEYRENEEFLVHELTHVKQYYRYLFTFRSLHRAYGKNPVPFEIEAVRAEVEYIRKKAGEGAAIRAALERVEALRQEYGSKIDRYKVYKLITEPPRASLPRHIITAVRIVVRKLRIGLALLFQESIGTRSAQTNKL